MREEREFNKRKFILEKAIRGDFALVKAKMADKAGNLVFSKTARNFNPSMCKAAKVTIAEVEEIVEIGEIPPDQVHVPAIYVHRVVQGEQLIKNTEFKPVTENDKSVTKNPMEQSKEIIARRAACEFKNGMYANLGIGLPTGAMEFIPSDISVFLHSENGLLGMGPFPAEDDTNADLINAGKQTITCIPGNHVKNTLGFFLSKFQLSSKVLNMKSCVRPLSNVNLQKAILIPQLQKIFNCLIDSPL